MIHNTFLIRISNKEILATTKYWPVDIPNEALDEFVSTREDLRTEHDEVAELALTVGEYKFHAEDIIPDVLLVFVTDKDEDESSIFEKVQAAKKVLKKGLTKSGLEHIRKNFERLIEPSVVTRLKIALVGEGGVGKTTTLHLLLGDTPPLQYVPTIALNLETVENIRFGNYSLVLWDFAGQERFRTLWRFYFHGADVIFLVCDSALRNVIISKDILKLIKRDAPKVPVFAMANKQDKPNAMKPEVVQKILGIPTYPMVAIDKSRRDEMLRILMTAASQYVGVALPDLPASELLKFTDTATEDAIAETDAIETLTEEEALEDDEEYETVVEEVLVDEDGHVIEDMDGYEIVEEVIEEVSDEDEEEAEEEAIEEEPEEEILVKAEVEEEPVEVSGEVIEEVPVEVEEETPVVEEEIEIEVTEPAEPDIIFAPEVEFTEVAAEESSAESVDVVSMDDLPIMPSSDAVSVDIQEDEPIVSVSEEDEIFASAEISSDPEVVAKPNDHDVRMAKEIIFEALEADDIISAEIDLVPHEDLDEALEAFGSDEALPSEEEEIEGIIPKDIAEESLSELESILGPLDRSISSPTPEEETEEEESHLPVDNESLKELSDLLDFVESDEDEY
ncbi:MAG: ADP-ribosylation factor-like protein [Candidatus Thorarchaeota archaeon]